MNRQQLVSTIGERPWLETNPQKVRLAVIAALLGAVAMLPIALFATTSPEDWWARLLLLIPGAVAGGLAGLVVGNWPARRAASVGLFLVRAVSFLVGFEIGNVEMRAIDPITPTVLPHHVFGHQVAYLLVGAAIGIGASYYAERFVRRHIDLIMRALTGSGK